MKKGFTLTELLAVVVLLAIIMTVVYPNLTEQLQKKEEQISEKKLDLVYSAASTYLSNNPNLYPVNDSGVVCVFIKELKNAKLLPIDVSDNIADTQIVKIKVGTYNKNSYSIENSCTSIDETGSKQYTTMTCSANLIDSGVNIEYNSDYYFKASYLTNQSTNIDLSYSNDTGKSNFSTVKQKYIDLYNNEIDTLGASPIQNNGTTKYNLKLEIDYKKYSKVITNNTKINIYDATRINSDVNSNEQSKGYNCITN